MSLNRRLKKLEGKGHRLKVIFTDDCLSWEEKQESAEEYRRQHGLPLETAIIVIDGPDAKLL